jgi:hypothetical protein
MDALRHEETREEQKPIERVDLNIEDILTIPGLNPLDVLFLSLINELDTGNSALHPNGVKIHHDVLSSKLNCSANAISKISSRLKDKGFLRVTKIHNSAHYRVDSAQIKAFADNRDDELRRKIAEMWYTAVTKHSPTKLTTINQIRTIIESL